MSTNQYDRERELDIVAAEINLLLKKADAHIEGGDWGPIRIVDNRSNYSVNLP